MNILSSFKCFLTMTTIASTSLTIEKSSLRSYKRRLATTEQASLETLQQQSKKISSNQVLDKKSALPTTSSQKNSAQIFKLSSFAFSKYLIDEKSRSLVPHHSLSDTATIRYLYPLWDHEFGFDHKRIKAAVACDYERDYSKPAQTAAEIAQQEFWEYIDTDFTTYCYT